MTGSHQAVLGLAHATLRDAVRRPAFLVGVVALGALLALLPRLGSPAAGLRDNASLAVELSIATITIAGPLVAGVLGFQAMQRDHDAGLTQELLSAPRGAGTYALGRWFGVSAAATLFCILAVAVGSVGWLGRPGPRLPIDVAPWCALFIGIPVAVLLGTCLGFVYGIVASRDLGIVCLVLHLTGVRFAASWAVDAVPAAQHVLQLVPDPSRLDVASDFAFCRPIGDAAFGLSVVAAGLHLAAMMIAVPVLLRGRSHRKSL